METDRRNQTITRYRPPGIVPLELWDLQVGSQILWDLMSESNFPEILGDAIEGLRRGEGQTRSEGSVPRLISGFDSLYLTGRRSMETPIRSALGTLSMPTHFSQTPDYPGAVEALRVLAEFRCESAWICDLGQTSFKICSNAGSRQFVRDLRELPVRTDAPDESSYAQRKQLRHWLANSMRVFLNTGPAPQGLLFALPSRLSDAGIPEGSSYIGMGGDGTIVADVIADTGLKLAQVLVMNDAELAAMEALAEPALRSCSKTLVLTLGFGVGAALVLRNQTRSHA